MPYHFGSLVVLGSSVLFSVAITTSPTLAQSEQEICLKSNNPSWTPTEQFVWKKLCEEDVADLRQKSDSEKIVTPSFLKDILVNEKYSQELPQTITIKGAIFKDKIELGLKNIDKAIIITDSTFNNTVNLSSSEFSSLVVFDYSTFTKQVNLSDTTIKGVLSFKNVQFRTDDDCDTLVEGYKDKNNSNIPKNNTLVNLKRLQVNKSLEFQKAKFSCKYPEKINKKENKTINLVDLNAAKIKVSLELQEILLDIKNQENNSSLDLGIRLAAAEIGDAIIIDSKISEKSQRIDSLDLSNIQAKALVYFVNNTFFEQLEDYRLIRLLNSTNKEDKKLPSRTNLQLINLNLENANIDTISILENNSEPESKESASQKFLEKDNSKNSFCNFNLSGFNYTQLNEPAYKFLTICIDSLYQEATQLANESKEQQKANKQMIELLQPMEKLAVISKNLGVYRVEQEMMYRQKKLTYFINKTNLISSREAIREAFKEAFNKYLFNKQERNLKQAGAETWQGFLESGRLLTLFFSLASNVIQDSIYGFGFYRFRVLYLIISILTANFFLALFVSYNKQKKIAYSSLYYKTREIEDERLKNCSTADVPLTLEEIKQEIDLIRQIIFESYDEEKLAFYLYIKYNDENEENSYKKIVLNQEEFKYLIHILDTRNPTHSKVGFCRNYYPKGNWSVVIYPHHLCSLDDLEEIKKVDLYLIDNQEVIKNMEFHSINPLGFLQVIKKCLNCLSIRFLQPIVIKLKCMIKKLKSYIPKIFRQIIHRVRKMWNYSLILGLLTAIALGGLIIIIIFPVLNCLLKPFTLILPYLKPIAVVVSIYLIILILKFLRERDVCRVTKKNVENAVLFSIDILVPIIELDQDNFNFIIDAAEDYRWIRIYFRLEKLVGPLLLSILLPVLLLTGL